MVRYAQHGKYFFSGRNEKFITCKSAVDCELSRRDNTLLTVDFNLRNMNIARVQQSPAGTTLYASPKVPSLRDLGSCIVSLVRRLHLRLILVLCTKYAVKFRPCGTVHLSCIYTIFHKKSQLIKFFTYCFVLIKIDIIFAALNSNFIYRTN